MNAARLFFYTQMARIEYWYKFDILGAIFWMRLAFLALRGKIVLIDSKDAESNGGYKYKTLIVSKRPLSDTNTYEGF